MLKLSTQCLFHQRRSSIRLTEPCVNALRARGLRMANLAPYTLVAEYEGGSCDTVQDVSAAEAKQQDDLHPYA